MLPDKNGLSHDMCHYQVMMMLHFLNDVAKHTESILKIENYVIIVSLKGETMGKLINRILRLCLLISSLPGPALKMHVESLGMSTSVLKALPGKLDIERHVVLSIYIGTSSQSD